MKCCFRAAVWIPVPRSLLSVLRRLVRPRASPRVWELCTQIRTIAVIVPPRDDTAVDTLRSAQRWQGLLGYIVDRWHISQPHILSLRFGLAASCLDNKAVHSSCRFAAPPVSDATPFPTFAS